MTYTIPTPADLKTMFPPFVAVADPTVQAYIDTASTSYVDTSWLEADYTFAIELAAAHLMTMAGIGAGAEAAVNAQGLGRFSLIRSGQLTLQRNSASQNGGSGIPAQWSGSDYGEQYYWLLRKNKPPIVAAGGSMHFPGEIAWDC